MFVSFRIEISKLAQRHSHYESKMLMYNKFLLRKSTGLEYKLHNYYVDLYQQDKDKGKGEEMQEANTIVSIIND